VSLPAERVEVSSADEFRVWLEANGDRTAPAWIVTYKKHVPGRHVPWGDVIDELLCFGWIDSLARRLDEDRMMVLVGPRKPGSAWSRVNKEKVGRLVAEGRMRPRGLAKVDAAKADGSWAFLDDVEALVVPDDLAEALSVEGQAAVGWAAYAPSARKMALYWLKQARSERTRQRRVQAIVAAARSGHSLVQGPPPGGAGSSPPS
jgi:uncharacterized protein YdeI (YjbR/CyaY-like superfamily)